MKKTILNLTLAVCALTAVSCSSALNLGGLKYRSAGSQYISGDLGQAVMIERAGQNHAVPLSKFKMNNVQFEGASGKIFQETESWFGFSSKLEGFSAGEISAATAEIGSGEEGEPVLKKTEKGSHVVFYPEDHFKFMAQINSPENRDLRLRLKALQGRNNRAMGVITRVSRVYGHESTKKIAGSATLRGKYVGGDFQTTVNAGRTSEVKLEDGSVSGYLVARLEWDKDNPTKIADLLTLDYVGIDSPKFRWLNWFIR